MSALPRRLEPVNELRVTVIIHQPPPGCAYAFGTYTSSRHSSGKKVSALASPVTAAASTLLLAACALPFASVAHSEAGSYPALKSSVCNLPTTRDLIIWQRAPGLQDSAFQVGDADIFNCKPTLDTWRADQPTGPGYCSKIAWASDNPSYDISVRPAPPLKDVVDQVGDC